MTNADLFDFVRAWIVSIVGSSVPVVRAYADAPAPVAKGAFIALEDDALWTPIGQRTDGATDGVNRLVITDYEVKFVVWECRGEGELLRQILERFQTFTTQVLFDEKYVARRRVSPVVRLPNLLDKAAWLVNHRVELYLGISRSVSESVPSIGAVGIAGSVSAGNDDIGVTIDIVTE